MERVDIYDNFFETGGDWLRAIDLPILIRRALHVGILLATNYHSPRIEEIAPSILHQQVGISTLKKAGEFYAKIDEIQDQVDY